jgi:hypothetical protein
MSYVQHTLRSPRALTRFQRNTIKAALIGLGYLAGLVVIIMAQIALDRMAADADPDQTSIAAA